MKSILCVIMLLFCLSRADFLQLDRWPVIEGISREIFQGLFSQLQQTVFPDFIHNFGGWILNNTMVVKDFRITSLTPRFMFMKPTFYPNNEGTFTITMPLGFHLKAEFIWLYNSFILPISGSATLDTDIHDLCFNTTLKYSSTGGISVSTNLSYSLIKTNEIDTEGFIGSDAWIDAPAKLLVMINDYYPLLQKSINSIFSKVMPDIYLKHAPESLKLKLYYPTFHIVKELNLPLSGLTTRESLLYVFGTPSTLPDIVHASDKVNRQYCVDQGLLNTVVKEIWKDMKGTYRSGDLPKNSIYQLTVIGMGQLVPDVLIDFPKDAEVTLTLTQVKDYQPDIKLQRINATHGIAKNFPMLLRYAVSGVSIMDVTLTFDIITTPTAERRGIGYDFNMNALSATVQKGSIHVATDYKSHILSNIHASSTEFLTYLIIPFLGHTLLGDGIWISDAITERSTPEFAIAEAAVCLSLIKVI